MEFKNGKCSIKSRIPLNIPLVDETLKLSSIDSISKHVSELLSKSLQPLDSCSGKAAFLLSGGLDSSILYKICDNLWGVDTTYSMTYPFESKGNMEESYALSASEAFNTTHNIFRPRLSDFLKGFIEAIDVIEESLFFPSSVMYYLLFKDGLPKDKRVVISGQGADGVFGTRVQYAFHKLNTMPFKLLQLYPFRKSLAFASYLTRNVWSSYRPNSSIFQNIHGVSRLAEDIPTKTRYPHNNPNSILASFGKGPGEEWVYNYFNVTNKDTFSQRFNAIKPYESRSIEDLISIIDVLGDVAVTQQKWSKLAERNGKIICFPYTCDALIEYAYSIPWHIKVQKPKNILRNIARQLDVPEFIITRPKSAMGITADIWGQGGVFAPLIPLCAKVFPKAEMVGLQSLDPKKSTIFWNMLNYAIWKRLCIHNESVEELLEELSL